MLVGGRHSTYIGLNLMNHDLKLRGISYQNPKSESVFYESDSRDNLEKNIGENNSLKHMISSAPANIQFFLEVTRCSWKPFLDGSNILGPTTNTGWNIYQ